MAGERFFVIDDDPFMRELLADALTEAGYSVTSAETGAEALRMLNGLEFDVALLDLSLPDIDGMELVPQIAGAAPESQLIIMTGYPSLESAIRALQEGARDYIVKPFKIPEMLAAAGRALTNQKRENELRDLRRRVRDLEEEVRRLRASGATPEGRAQAAVRPTGLPGAYGALSPRRGPAPERPPEAQP